MHRQAGNKPSPAAVVGVVTALRQMKSSHSLILKKSTPKNLTSGCGWAWTPHSRPGNHTYRQRKEQLKWHILCHALDKLSSRRSGIKGAPMSAECSPLSKTKRGGYNRGGGCAPIRIGTWRDRKTGRGFRETKTHH
eukprot:1160534-Pelagomonas_calceolata.AAC.20